MDIICKHCGEPIDTDEFHGTDWPWRDWIASFKLNGCGAVDALFDGLSPDCAEKCKEKPDPAFQGDMVELVQDMLGDDIDGLSVMQSDHMGYFWGLG